MEVEKDRMIDREPSGVSLSIVVHGRAVDGNQVFVRRHRKTVLRLRRFPPRSGARSDEYAGTGSRMIATHAT